MNKLIVYILLLFIPTQLDAQELMKGELKRELLPQPVSRRILTLSTFIGKLGNSLGDG